MTVHLDKLGYGRLKDRVKLEGLTALQTQRSDQIDDQRKKLMSMNMCTKLTPLIMSYCCLRYLKKEQYDEALR